jgi:hypothetical protein
MYIFKNITKKNRHIRENISETKLDKNTVLIMYHKSNINILRRVDLEYEHVESMRFGLQTKVHPILVNINYRS